MSARHVALGAAYGVALGMFARAVIEHLDRLAHNAPPKARP